MKKKPQALFYLPLEKAARGPSTPQSTGNAKGTVSPKGPDKTSSSGSGRRGAPSPESPKKGAGKPEISKRGRHKPPHVETDIKVRGTTDVSNTFDMVFKNVDTGKSRRIRVGKANRARFNHEGNLISVVIDGKKYPTQNHLVTLPKGVYRFSGMVSVAAQVGKV